MYSFRKSKKGFTLIELMVVVAIIAVLALLGLRMYSTQQDKAKEAIVKANAGSVQVTIQTEIVDVPTLTRADAILLGDLEALHNPFTGYSGTDTGGIANVVVATGDLTSTNALREGIVGVYFSDPVFTIIGYGVDGVVILNYELTAQR